MMGRDSRTGDSRVIQGGRQREGRAWIMTTLVAGVGILLVAIYPTQGAGAMAAFEDSLLEMLLVMPAVFIIMGLFSVWVPSETINRYLGRNSGARGMVVAIVIGMLPTGPLYAAFPLVKGLVDKGASPANMFAFTAAWACIKVPQELIEIQFLGWRFALARFLATLVVIVLMSGVFECVYRLGSAPQTQGRDDHGASV